MDFISVGVSISYIFNSFIIDLILLNVLERVSILIFICSLRRSRYLYLSLIFSSVSISLVIWKGKVLLILITSNSDTSISESPKKTLLLTNDLSLFLNIPLIDM